MIISNTRDPTADVVVRELNRRNTPFCRLNTDEFPCWIRGSVSIEGSSTQKILAWDNRAREVDLSSISSVWYRRPTAPKIDYDLPSNLSQFVRDECYDFIRGLWYSLDCFWISEPDAIRRAEHKVYRLTIAARLGLPVPRTLVSNDPERIRSFAHTCASGVVAKAVYMGFLNDPPRSIFASTINPVELEDTQSLRMAPVIFQERIRKICDIRVTVIGQKVFAAEIRSPYSDSIPDWRSAEIDKLEYRVHDLSSTIQDKCLYLVRQLGLTFGAIDLAITEEGDYFFFEINPNGQWAWIQPKTQLPLTATLANLLERPLG